MRIVVIKDTLAINVEKIETIRIDNTPASWIVMINEEPAQVYYHSEMTAYGKAYAYMKILIDLLANEEFVFIDARTIDGSALHHESVMAYLESKNVS